MLSDNTVFEFPGCDEVGYADTRPPMTGLTKDDASSALFWQQTICQGNSFDCRNYGCCSEKAQQDDCQQIEHG